MNKNNTKFPGRHHGMRPFRGLDKVDEASVCPGPMIENPEEFDSGKSTSMIFGKAKKDHPEPGRFGRIFKKSGYNPTNDAIKKLAERMREINNPSGDNEFVPIGFAFLGQFIDHDLTLDATSLFGRREDPQAVVDFRTPNLDLDNLYGAGPGVDRFMYDTTEPFDKNPVKLLVDKDRDFDLPRNSQNTAIIGDLRNDENLIVSQLHLAFIKFHNAVVDFLLKKNPQRYQVEHGETLLFGDASQEVRWHYQWIILQEFLPKILGKEVVEDVLKNGTKLYDWKKYAKYPFMPIEFSIAAYRLGHTMLRQDYRVNDHLKKDLFELPVFGAPKIDESYKLDFKKFFDYPGAPPAQRARKFDAQITDPVYLLPFIDKIKDPPPSLAERNMLRAKIFGLPSGQEVAKIMNKLGVKVPVYTNKDLGIDDIKGLDGAAPLWFYILKESEFSPNDSKQLGPVGGRIVAEFIITILKDIKGNYLHDDKNWKPTLKSGKKNDFKIVDLLEFAGA